VPPRPAHPFTAAQLELLLEFLLEERVVVSEAIAEKGKRLGKRAAPGDDLGAALREQVEGGEVLKDSHRIVRTQNCDGARQVDAFRARGGCGEHHRGPISKGFVWLGIAAPSNGVVEVVRSVGSADKARRLEPSRPVGLYEDIPACSRWTRLSRRRRPLEVRA